jgi:hypothetical protein
MLGAVAVARVGYPTPCPILNLLCSRGIVLLSAPFEEERGTGPS